MEFAVIANVFMILLMGVFEVSYDLFAQVVVDGALQVAARELQTGNAQNVTNSSQFLNKYLCPALGGFLSCSNIYIQVQKISPTSSQDEYNFTTGTLPTNADGSLNLSQYANTSFCNSGPSQLIIINAIYVGPTLVGGFVPLFSILYSGQRVHATMSTVSVVTESYPLQAATGTVAPSC